MRSPQARQLDASTSACLAECGAAKSRMTSDVVLQLQRISGQQSKIRDVRARLQAHKEVLGTQEVKFAELKMATR